MHMQRVYEVSEFGQLCKRGRSPFGMTRPEMARKLGVSPSYVSDIESGKFPPPEGYVCAITGLLGLSTADVKSAIEADKITRDTLATSHPIARR
ncbi:MAG: helix-turn-helix domain-containing protein [Allorhizobium sp.]|uniref:helix-turn-helix domain-containing protein n=2 Tax=Allorhizobium sp. TaxID=633478 RepID=UPI0040346D66